jgi:flagellar M-ring protein FliF
VRFGERLRALSLRAKLIGVAAIVVAIAAALVATMIQRDQRVALFAEPLRPEQVSEVTQRLAEWNVGFVTGADNVRVDQRRRNDLLLRLALAGLPHAHVSTSAELLEKVGPLTPSPVLEAEQRDGLAGDVELALRGVAGIDDARVIVAPARQGTFADDAGSAASAGVRLTLHPGVALSRDVVGAIRTFVAAAVPGLLAKRVTVLDDRGLTLDPAGAPPSEGGGALAASLQSALDTVFGAGSTVVRVNVAFDAKVRDLHEVRREPLGVRAIAATRSDERYDNDKKRYRNQHTTEDRGSDLREERTQIPPGNAERISAAVLVDAARSLDLAKIRSIASATIGLRPERGDSLAIESVRFVRPVQPSSPAVDVIGLASTLAPLVVIAVATLIALRLVVKPALSAFEAVKAHGTLRHQAASTLGPAQVHGALRGEPPHTIAAVIGALPTATAAAVLELYAPEERAAIVQRLNRSLAPVARGLDALIHRG